MSSLILKFRDFDVQRCVQQNKKMFLFVRHRHVRSNFCSSLVACLPIPSRTPSVGVAFPKWPVQQSQALRGTKRKLPNKHEKGAHCASKLSRRIRSMLLWCKKRNKNKRLTNKNCRRHLHNRKHSIDRLPLAHKSKTGAGIQSIARK